MIKIGNAQCLSRENFYPFSMRRTIIPNFSSPSSSLRVFVRSVTFVVIVIIIIIYHRYTFLHRKTFQPIIPFSLCAIRQGTCRSANTFHNNYYSDTHILPLELFKWSCYPRKLLHIPERKQNIQPNSKINRRKMKGKKFKIIKRKRQIFAVV